MMAYRCRIERDAALPDYQPSHKAASSAVGYQGFKATNRDAMGVSYWQDGPANVAAAYAVGRPNLLTC